MDLSNHHVKKYIEYHEIYTKKYGENTVVLMQSEVILIFSLLLMMK